MRHLLRGVPHAQAAAISACEPVAARNADRGRGARFGVLGSEHEDGLFRHLQVKQCGQTNGWVSFEGTPNMAGFPFTRKQGGTPQKDEPPIWMSIDLGLGTVGFLGRSHFWTSRHLRVLRGAPQCGRSPPKALQASVSNSFRPPWFFPLDQPEKKEPSKKPSPKSQVA